MVAFTKFQPFVENLAEKVFNLGSDTCKVFASATAPTNTWGTLSQVTEISYTNLSARTLTTSTSAQSGGTYTLLFADLVLTASGAVATFRYIGIYDDTAASDELIGYYDYGSDITMQNGETLTIDFTTSTITIT